MAGLKELNGSYVMYAALHKKYTFIPEGKFICSFHASEHFEFSKIKLVDYYTYIF